ncbi:hypothetical protein [Anthocerotibacter panamensis]|uniref:hypothetical protein n=1 Tax=Anthocerotibacter panamensis TaxID=2857077 RepID=UPI001C408399|nr:hypothetical protein [Anthocerotibacter panamensis]
MAQELSQELNQPSDLRYSLIRSVVRQRIAERFAERVPLLIAGAKFQLLSDAQAQELLSDPSIVLKQEFNTLEGGTLFYHRLFDRYFWLTREPDGPFSFYERHLIRSTVAMHACMDKALEEWGTDSADPLSYLLSPGDHILSAFLQSTPGQPVVYQSGWLVQMLEVMRPLVRATFENKPLQLGVLIDPQRCQGKCPMGSFSIQLAESKVFQRLSDGDNIVYLTDTQGNLVQLVDFSQTSLEIPADTPPLYPTLHTRQAQATRKSGSILLLLTREGSVQIFWQGEWAFELRHQGWRLLDLGTKYKHLVAHVGTSLARIVFQTAVDLAANRHGAILLILDDPEKRHQLLMQKDDLRTTGPVDQSYAKALLHPLVVNLPVQQMSPSLLANLASLDGAVVLDREGHLHSFGAILKNPADELLFSDSSEGARTKTARLASRYGYAIKVSQDGELVGYRHGRMVWRT